MVLLVVLKASGLTDDAGKAGVMQHIGAARVEAISEMMSILWASGPLLQAPASAGQTVD